jgi:hypothetical protein
MSTNRRSDEIDLRCEAKEFWGSLPEAEDPRRYHEILKLAKRARKDPEANRLLQYVLAHLAELSTLDLFDAQTLIGLATDKGVRAVVLKPIRSLLKHFPSGSQIRQRLDRAAHRPVRLRVALELPSSTAVSVVALVLAAILAFLKI